jgi:hypothetical protein
MPENRWQIAPCYQITIIVNLSYPVAVIPIIERYAGHRDFKPFKEYWPIAAR